MVLLCVAIMREHIFDVTLHILTNSLFKTNIINKWLISNSIRKIVKDKNHLTQLSISYLSGVMRQAFEDWVDNNEYADWWYANIEPYKCRAILRSMLH